ncbi:Lactonase, 7-bladed beta propeller [Metarhizium rileyi]|uniref:Lactonase, 7-bladed beta propeller n=1 Tax=Metarhizium rileyi (strain RCEF 4871) TaxID=1649241 RepID=A0A167H8Z2_METRR|nr:Lactonase, 7-bladed beta propeller [Metarhizium rileyi RCEF 4871]
MLDKILTLTFTLLLLLTPAQAAAPDMLYVSSYSGKITTLVPGVLEKGVGLSKVSSTDECGASPSWLTLNRANSTLFCINEDLASGKGSISSFKTSAKGSLTSLGKTDTTGSPVSGVLYGPGKSGLAVAHYGGDFTTWDLSSSGKLALVLNETYHMDKPGPNADRQKGPHPHQASLDPTGKFILVPDLGADKIHVYAVASDSLKVKCLPSVAVKAGSGPRHVAFAVRDGKTFMYLVTELSSSIIGYEVAYPSGSIGFKELFNIGAHGADKPVSKTAYASEVVVSPDAKFLLVSSRGDNSLTIPNFDPNNSTSITSDPIINFSIDGKTGKLSVIQETASGGRFPRHFSVNKAGTLVAVGLQKDSRVVLIKRDPQSGKLGEFAGHANVAGEISSVIFDE